MKLKVQLLPDSELIYLFKTKQCEASISEIISRYKEKVFTQICFIVKDHYLAEDIFQETMIKAINNIKAGKYKEDGKLAPWLARIAYNLCIDTIRKAKSSHQVQLVCQEEATLDYLQNQFVANNNVFQNETEIMIWKVLNKLPEEQLEVVLLRIYGDMSFREIAEAMGVSINTALGRMRYALTNLRKMLQEYQLVEWMQSLKG